FQLKNDRQLVSFLDTVQELIKKRVLEGTFSFWNVYRILSVLRQYPWKETNETTPLPMTFVRAVRKQVGAWAGSVLLHSFSTEQGRLQRKLIQDALRGKVHKIHFQRMKNIPFDLTDRKILQAYWRKKTPPPDGLDPDRDRCGVIWFSPAIPFRGKEVRAVL